MAFADTFHSKPHHLHRFTMKWLRFLHQGQPGLGCLQGDQVVVHEGSLFETPRPTTLSVPLDQLSLIAPCQPSKVLALWNNFHAAADKNGWSRPDEPLYFLKSPNTYSHHLAPVPRPRAEVGRIMFEAELGVVIGRQGRDIPIESAAEHIFGFTCINDVTALELLRSDPSFEQWTRAKNFDGFMPMGPWIETDLDWRSAHVTATVNGRVRQHFPLHDMIFSPPELISRLSRDMTLQPGDVIACGTSLGAMPWANDASVEVSIEGLGTLSNTLREQP